MINRPIRKRQTLRLSESTQGVLFALPWFIGSAIFLIGPMLASLFMSFTDWDIVRQPEWIGVSNYARMFLQDNLFWKSLGVTTLYAALSVPLELIVAMLLALLLNRKIRGVGLYRTIYYLPSILSGVAVALLWMWIFNPEFGLLNHVLGWFGIPPLQWLYDSKWVIPSFAIMRLWSVGGGMIIYLAGLQGIPTELYEAAEIDGAGAMHKFLRVTLPMMSPIILYNLVLGIINSMQSFANAYIMTDGGPNNASLFYVLYLYRNAFQYFRMGYASSLAWVLFLYILLLTLLIFRKSEAWVYYEGSLRGR
ncbi:MAG: sugar ABC transporter permease [Firmicutes bacterium]|nr:sugar ABC transporter permease [Bacillota bacterium]